MNNIKKTTIGGQALFEGILMRGPEKVSIVLREESGDLKVKTDKFYSVADRYKILKIPFLRGIVSLFESLIMGTQAIVYSTDEEEEKDEKGVDMGTILTLIVSLSISVLVFFFVPTLVTSIFKKYLSNVLALNLIEGLIRILLFLGYISLISNLEDMKRIFMYHGAEHKTIHCYEKGMKLTVENVRTCSRLHRRCGTSFLFTVMIVSILVLSNFGWPNPLMRLLIRLIMLPVIVGVSYEINKVLGRSDSIISKALTAPGLLIQKLGTVKEPTDDMIEVAIKSLEEVIPEDESLDIW